MDLVVDYAVLFVMNVCEEKREAKPARELQNSFCVCLPACSERGRHAAGVPRFGWYMNFSMQDFTMSLSLLHALAHTAAIRSLARFNA